MQNGSTPGGQDDRLQERQLRNGVALAQPPLIVMIVFLVIGLGLAAPFVLLSFTPAFAKVLPKPGRWMETFRQALAFPMFLTAVWLLWVLAGQAGSNGVVVVIAGAAVLGFGIWLATKIGRTAIGRVVAAGVIVAAFVVPPIATASIRAPAGGESLATEAGGEPWSVERVAELRSEGRIIFVDFTARWCVTCQVNKSIAIDSQSVRKAFEESTRAEAEPVRVLARLAALAVAGLVFALVLMALDLARVRSVRDDRRDTVRLFLRALGTLLRRPLLLFGVWGWNALARGLVIAAGMALAAGLPVASWGGIVALFAVQQAAFYVRAGLRVALWSSELALVDSLDRRTD